MKLLIVLGEGGHTTEMLNLVDLLGDHYEYHYVLTREDNLSADHIRRPGPLYRLSRPRGKDTKTLPAILRTIRTTFETLPVLLRVRPDAVVSVGPAIGVPVCILGKLLGARIIFIETGSHITFSSMTGRILYRWADLYFVQWPQLAQKLDRAIYAGRLI